ncbi:restriction endonuclease [Geomonas azotofigens]|uniref:restriction endonuclease n=1 Tax=Geomonas azotofigens TaxID=2843196 RepID=UPI001C0FCBDB|nr:restriction endonuclease [Geomonas azotofigens]MBU5613748.1 restriction endonuclease [Geomonas azotofigens]
MDSGIILDFAENRRVNAPYVVVEDGCGPDAQSHANIEFFKTQLVDKCIFCHASLSQPYYRPPGGLGVETIVQECPNCGWWQLKQEFSSPGGCMDEVVSKGFFLNGIVRRFDASDKQLPLNVLLQEVNKRKDILYRIAPKKMEELVAHVFSQFYSTEVIHCGQSHDGGVDLILVAADEPTLVQVKRRETPSHVEAVSTVREFLGAVMLNSSQQAILVSTADHFSREASEAALKAEDLSLLNRFELVDFKRFVQMLHATGSEDNKPWAKFLNSYW